MITLKMYNARMTEAAELRLLLDRAAELIERANNLTLLEDPGGWQEMRRDWLKDAGILDNPESRSAGQGVEADPSLP